MRAHTTLRTAFRFSMTMAAAAGVTFAASQARADVAGGSAGPNSSTGTAALKFDMAQGLDTSVDTGFMGPDLIQVRAVVKIDPVKAGGPLYSVSMPNGAVVEASWSGDKKIVLRAATGTQTDGTVKVRHTLTPSLEMKVSAFGLTATFNFDATSVVNKLPGAQFAFDSTASQAFAPWGFTPVVTKLNAPDLSNAVLFSEPLSKFDNIVNVDDWAGTIGVRATTKPTFSYKTTKVMLSGSSAPITSSAGESVIDAQDADYMELMAQVEGAMDVAGTMDIQPFVSLTKVFGYNFSTQLGVNAYSKDYTVPTSKVAYQSTLVHIPLPNVHAPRAGVDLGAVKSGGSATKTVSIENSGEKEATLSFKSSDPQFSVPGGNIVVAPKSKYDMQIRFSPSSAGAASSEIAVLSNDPDSPLQVFSIGANGADVGADGSDEALPGAGPEADSGCGCKTAGTSTSTGGFAGLGLLGLGLAVAARRRRAAR